MYSLGLGLAELGVVFQPYRTRELAACMNGRPGQLYVCILLYEHH
jgi:hypothetical protein